MAIELEDFCQTVQQDLVDLAGSNYPAMKREPTGLLDAVRSESNRSGFSQNYITDGGDGKLKQVLIEWIKPIPVSTTVTTMQDICEAGTEEPVFRDVKTLTGFASTRVIEFSDAELRKLCDAPSEHRAKVISAHMSGLFRKVNQICIAKYNTGVGGFIGGVAAGKNVEFLHYDGITEAAKPDGEIVMMEDMQNLGVTGKPLVVGSGIISRYSKLAQIGCCNDYGQDVSDLSGAYDFYRDRDVDIVLGTSENVFAFAPGAVQLATYNMFRGDFRKVVPNVYVHDTITDPVQGITVDVKMKYDDCAHVWRMAYFLHFDLFLLTNDMFYNADERDGVNYAFKYKAVRTVTP